MFSWRQQSFSAEQSTTVRVRFEPTQGKGGPETRVSVEHTAWDGIPREHAARHGLALPVFQLRHAEWWRVLLGALKVRAEVPPA